MTILNNFTNRVKTIYTSTVNNLKDNGMFFNIMFILIIATIILLVVIKDDNNKLELFFGGDYSDNNLENWINIFLKNKTQLNNQETILKQQETKIEELKKKLTF